MCLLKTSKKRAVLLLFRYQDDQTHFKTQLLFNVLLSQRRRIYIEACASCHRPQMAQVYSSGSSALMLVKHLLRDHKMTTPQLPKQLWSYIRSHSGDTCYEPTPSAKLMHSVRIRNDPYGEVHVSFGEDGYASTVSHTSGDMRFLKPSQNVTG